MMKRKFTMHKWLGLILVLAVILINPIMVLAEPQNFMVYLPVILNNYPIPTPTPNPTLTYDVYSNRALWIEAIGGSISTEDFEKDPADYAELSIPYITGNGFLLTGQSVAQIYYDVTTLNSGNLLHFRDWQVGMTFTFPNSANVKGFGFDYRPSETWKLTVGDSTITLPGRTKGFVGIVVRSGDLNKFNLSCTSSAQGGLSVDNISFVKK